MLKKVLSLILAMLVIAACAAGCNNGSPEPTARPTAPPASTTTTPDTNTTTPDEEQEDEFALPLADGESFSMWYQFPLMSTVITSYNDSEVFKELEKLTGVHIDFIHPGMADFGITAFNLLLVSQEYPDTLSTFPMVWTAGLDKYIDDEVLIDLDDLVSKYTPHLKKFLDENDTLRKDSYTDTGRLPGFTQIQYQNEPGYTCGPALRKDIMDDLGLSVPVTYDDFYNVISTMHDSTNMTLGLLPKELGLMAGYNVNTNFMFTDSGEIEYAFIQEGFRKYLTTLSQWFSEGLIDPNFMTVADDFGMQELFNQEKIFGANNAFATYLGKSMYDMGATANEVFNLQAVPFPKEAADDVIHAGKIDGYVDRYAYRSAYQVTTAAKDPVLIAKWFNFMYSEEGILLTNYGFEGETFEYDENDNPRWTELIYNNPDGYNISETQQRYLLHFPPFSDFDKETKTYIYDEQLEAGSTWFDTDLKYALPARYSMTTDEGNTYTNIFNDIDTYVNEKMYKFITGYEDIEAEWDNYVKQIEEMEIGKVLDILEAACDRYNKR